MTPRLFRTPAALVFGTMLLACSTLAQTHSAEPQSPYGGVTVEEIIARVNNQIITRSDYDRALKEMDDEARQHGSSMQEISEAHKGLLRSLIDQQLWLSKGKELGINGETELVNRLNEIRKQYHLETLEDLEKAAKEQGISFEDFKANIRNAIITQEVMRDQVGRKIQFTPGEEQRYFEQHKQEYARPESVHLSEILVSSGDVPDDAEKLAAAKAKADDLEAKLQAGGDFAQLARTFSDGTTAASGGDLGQYQRGQLAKLLEDETFVLKAGQFTQPIHTRQGYVILKVVEHISGGVPEFKDVEHQVQDAFYMERMEPAIRDYLTKMRENGYVEVKPGYVDTGASPNRRVFPIAYSAYTPPAPKKKKKIERTRFRANTHTFRQKSQQVAAAPAEAPPDEATPAQATPTKKGKKAQANEASQASMMPGKKEKIRYGQAPTKTLPNAPESKTEDAGAVTAPVNAAPEPANPLENSAAPERKTRMSARAKQPKQHKAKGKQPDKQAPEAPDAAEVADRQTQSGPLGLGSDAAKKKTKFSIGEKTRFSDKNKKPAAPAQDTSAVPAAPTPLAPAPASTPAPQPQAKP